MRRDDCQRGLRNVTSGAAQRQHVELYPFTGTRDYAKNKFVAGLEEEVSVQAFLLWKDEQGCKPQESASVVLPVTYVSYAELDPYQQVSTFFL